MSDVVKAFGMLLYRIIEKEQNGKLNGRLFNIEFLFLKASYANKHWSPPKGLAEHNETGLETAERETLEETGLKKEKYALDNFAKTLKYDVKGKKKETTYFLAHLLNNSEAITLSEEHTEYKWIQKSETQDYLLPISFENLLKEAEEYIENKKMRVTKT